MDVMMVGRSNGCLKDYPMHQHGYWEIIFNDWGRGILTVEEKSFAFEPGDITVIPPGMSHKKEASEGFRDICMFIHDFRPVGGKGFRILRDDGVGTVRQLMELAWRFYQGQSVYEQAILNALGDALYQVLVLYYVKNQRKDPRLEGLLEIMHDHFNDPDFDLSEAIGRSGYCKGYFRRIFKEFTGTSPVIYLQQLRMDYAKSLMDQYNQSRSVKDIAASSGFKDPLYFSRIFKKFEGRSPKAYMKMRHSCDASMIQMDEAKRNSLEKTHIFPEHTGRSQSLI